MRVDLGAEQFADAVLIGDAREGVQLGIAKVEVDEERLVPALGQAAGQAERGERLPLVAERAGDRDGGGAAGQPGLRDVGPQFVERLIRGRERCTGSEPIAEPGKPGITPTTGTGVAFLTSPSELTRRAIDSKATTPSPMSAKPSSPAKTVPMICFLASF